MQLSQGRVQALRGYIDVAGFSVWRAREADTDVCTRSDARDIRVHCVCNAVRPPAVQRRNRETTPRQLQMDVLRLRFLVTRILGGELSPEETASQFFFPVQIDQLAG